MITLGIESTAHTLGIAVKDGDKIIHKLDTYQGSYIPRDLAEHKAKMFPILLKEFNMEVDLIAVSQGPGIWAPLSFGVSMANYLSSKYNIPAIGVNHGYAHIYIHEYLSKQKGELALYISGGNTSIVNLENLKIVGETLDIGIGNMFDKAARELGLKNAKELEDLALNHKNFIEAPYSVKGMHVNFGGLLTWFKNNIGKYPKEDLAYSLFHTSFSMLLETLARASFAFEKKNIIVCGGVAQSRILKQMLEKFSKFYNLNIITGPDEFNRDNAAMIAVTGEYLYNKGIRTEFPIKPRPYYRIDDLRYILT